MNHSVQQAADNRAITVGLLKSRLDHGLVSTTEALGMAYDAGHDDASEPPTVRARTLKQLFEDAAARRGH